MAGTINLQHDTRNSGANGYLTDGRIVTIGANPNGLGIFNYLGTNRNTAARTQPVYTASSTNQSTSKSPAVGSSVYVRCNSATSPLGWTDNNLAAAGVTLDTTVSLIFDFCAGFNAGSTVNGQSVSNMCLVKPDTIMLYWSGAVGGVVQGGVFEGSRDGITWETFGQFSDGLRSWVTGWVQYALQPKRYYRFIRVSGAGNATNSGLGNLSAGAGSNFYELDFAGKIKFLKTSKI